MQELPSPPLSPGDPQSPSCLREELLENPKTSQAGLQGRVDTEGHTRPHVWSSSSEQTGPALGMERKGPGRGRGCPIPSASLGAPYICVSSPGFLLGEFQACAFPVSAG